MIVKGKIVKYYSDKLALVEVEGQIFRAVSEVFIPENKEFLMLLEPARGVTKLVPLSSPELKFFLKLKEGGIEASYALLQIYRALRSAGIKYSRLEPRLFQYAEIAVQAGLSADVVVQCFKKIVSFSEVSALMQFLKEQDVRPFYSVMLCGKDIWMVIWQNDELFFIDPDRKISLLTQREEKFDLVTENQLIFNAASIETNLSKNLVVGGFSSVA